MRERKEKKKLAEGTNGQDLVPDTPQQVIVAHAQQICQSQHELYGLFPTYCGQGLISAFQ